MLGRTHVLSALAGVHSSFFAYRIYLDHGGDVGKDLFERMGVIDNEPLTVIQYALITTITLMFVLLLLRLGKAALRTSYFSILILSYFGLWVFSETMYPLELAGMMLAFLLGSLIPDID